MPKNNAQRFVLDQDEAEYTFGKAMREAGILKDEDSKDAKAVPVPIQQSSKQPKRP